MLFRSGRKSDVLLVQIINTLWIHADVSDGTLHQPVSVPFDPTPNHTGRDLSARPHTDQGYTHAGFDETCSPWYFGSGERHNANLAGRMVQIGAAGKYTLTQDCQEIPDPGC